MRQVPQGGEPYEKWYYVNFRKLLIYAGPGLLMSMGYLDPGNLEGDLQAGAHANYELLWLLGLATIMGFILQFLAIKVGVTTGDNLAAACRNRYNLPSSLFLLIMTEIAIIGSDIQEVIGSAIAIHIITLGHVPLIGGVIITSLEVFLVMFIDRFGARKLELVFTFFISLMTMAFVVEFFIAKPSILGIAKGLVIPRLRASVLVQATGMLGAVVMPHNLYLHSALVLSRHTDRHDVNAVRNSTKYFAIESAGALFISFLINLVVVSVFAVGFYGKPIAASVGLHNAAEMLQSEFGNVAMYVWAIGLLAAGWASTMTGTYAGQHVIQGFLGLQVRGLWQVAITRSVAIVPSAIVALLAQGYLDSLDEMLNVLQSIQLPFALIPLLHITSNRAIMHQHVNSIPLRIAVWFIALAVITINMYQVIQLISFLPSHPLIYLFALASLCIYFAIVFYLLLLEPLLTLYKDKDRWAHTLATVRVLFQGPPTPGSVMHRDKAALLDIESISDGERASDSDL